MAAVAASRANTRFRGSNDGLYVVEYRGEQSKAEFFNTPEINEIARSLSVGQIQGPIELGGIVQWLGLESIESKSEDWYDVQLTIEQQLRARQARIHHERYLDQLKSRASLTTFDEMLKRLTGIAEERYFGSAAKSSR